MRPCFFSLMVSSRSGESSPLSASRTSPLAPPAPPTGQVHFGTKVLDKTSICSLDLRASTGVFLSAGVTSSIGPSSSLPETFVLQASSTRGQDERHS